MARPYAMAYYIVGSSAFSAWRSTEYFSLVMGCAGITCFGRAETWAALSGGMRNAVGTRLESPRWRAGVSVREVAEHRVVLEGGRDFLTYEAYARHCPAWPVDAARPASRTGSGVLLSTALSVFPRARARGNGRGPCRASISCNGCWPCTVVAVWRRSARDCSGEEDGKSRAGGCRHLLRGEPGAAGGVPPDGGRVRPVALRLVPADGRR